MAKLLEWVMQEAKELQVIETERLTEVREQQEQYDNARAAAAAQRPRFSFNQQPQQPGRFRKNMDWFSKR